jgi:hypothetical protein
LPYLAVWIGPRRRRRVRESLPRLVPDVFAELSDLVGCTHGRTLACGAPAKSWARTIEGMTSFVAVLPLQPLEVGDGFSLSAWPLHLTVLPNFVTELEVAAVGRVLDEVSRGTSPIVARVAGSALFGRGENIPVSLVAESPALVRLHRLLLEGARGFDAVLENPAFSGDAFRPHITATKTGRAVEGDRLVLAQLALVDMAPDGDQRHRRVVWTCAFE